MKTNHLSSLTKQLLILTSLDTLSDGLEKQKVNIVQQIKQILHNYRWLMNEKDISLLTNMQDVSIEGNEAFLENSWEYLLSNALKYTTSGGSIEITLDQIDYGV